jgi:uncharacterized protein YqjF (DUF2071 family)
MKEGFMKLADTTHRPWPVPRLPWVLNMKWHDLLFMHWPIKSEMLRPYMPTALTLDMFDGTAWIGVVPFQMRGVRPRLVPALPVLSAFPELNVRTYVTAEGKPGVWFFSLDAGNSAAVEMARDVFHLAYYNARMSCQLVGSHVRYSSVRTHRNSAPAAFQGQYRPTGAVYRSTPGTLEHWLTERYCLYAANRQGQIWRGDIHHARWPLQPAEAEIERNTMTKQIGLTLPETKPILHFARYLDVVGWLPQRVGRR